MEKLYFNLSEEDVSKGRKILLWFFTAAFFIGGVYIIMIGPVLGKSPIGLAQSITPFGISFIIGCTAAYATIKRKDLYFLIDDDKVEFRYGIFKPKKYSFPWTDMKKLVLPHKERKVKVMFKDGTSFVINLSYIQRKKSIIIRKHLYYAAKSKNIDVLKVLLLSHHKTHSESHSPADANQK
jgi:hypothetical protein